MKKAILGLFALALLACVTAVAQDQSGQSPTKPDQMKSDTASSAAGQVAGTISQDGKTFVSDKDNKSWTIENPDAVKGHEGHHVAVSGQIDPATNALNVTSFSMVPASENNSDTSKDQPKN